MKELPQGWVLTKLGDVVHVLDNLRRPIKSADRNEGPYPYYGANGLQGYHSDFIFNERLLLVAEDGGFFGSSLRDIAYIVEGKYWVNNHAHVLKAKQDISLDYIFQYLRRFNVLPWITGTTVPKLNQKNLLDIPVLLPPKSEQERIAKKLQKVQHHIDSCLNKLNRVPVLLKQFRKTVLEAATSGRLSADMRAEDTSSSWEEVKVREVSTAMSYGSSSKSSPTGMVPVIRMGNIQEGKIDWNDLVFTSDKDEINKYSLEKGDVLFNRTNSPELVGKSAVFTENRPAIYAGYLIRIKCSDRVNPKFLYYCLASPSGRDYCWRVKTDGVNQSNINAQKLGDFTFLLPPKKEQQIIVDRAEKLLGWADLVKSHYESAFRKVNLITPSLLDKALRGDLAPQNPGDEPAENLLERIRALTSSVENAATRLKKSRKKVV